MIVHTSPFTLLASADFSAHKAYILRHYGSEFALCEITNFGDMPQLVGIDAQAALLRANTEAFLRKQRALHALLFGARGCGKSSLVKATLLPYLLDASSPLRVIELDSKDIALLPLIVDAMRKLDYCFIIFCDDLSLDINDSTYKSLKSALQGSIQAEATNLLLYATSNLRRLLEASTNHKPSDEVIHEEMSLSERFGLQIGFYDIGTDEYLAHIARLIDKKDMLHDATNPHIAHLRNSALNFASKMGARNARVAEEFAIALKNKLISL